MAAFCGESVQVLTWIKKHGDIPTVNATATAYNEEYAAWTNGGKAGLLSRFQVVVSHTANICAACIRQTGKKLLLFLPAVRPAELDLYGE